MSSGDRSALPVVHGPHSIPLASLSCDRNREERKWISRRDRGGPSRGRSYAVEKGSPPRRSMRNSKPRQSLRLGRGSAKPVRTCCARNPIESSGEGSQDRLENRETE